MKTHHFAALAIFALLVSAGFAALGERTLASRLRYAAWCFGLFMAFAVAFAWLLFPVSR